MFFIRCFLFFSKKLEILNFDIKISFDDKIKNGRKIIDLFEKFENKLSDLVRRSLFFCE